MTRTRRILTGSFMTFVVAALFSATAAAQVPQTTTQKTKGEATWATSSS